jgi:type IV pilus assembly protein PilB
MPPRKRLGEILVEAGVLDEGGLRAALREQTRWGGPLGRHLIEMRLIREETLISALSKQLGIPAVDLSRWEVPQSVIDLLDGDVALNLSAIPFQVEGKFLDVALGEPTNVGAIDEIQMRTKHNVRPYIAGPKAIERAMAKYYQRGPGGTEIDIDVSESEVMELTDDYELAAPPSHQPVRNASSQAARSAPAANSNAEVRALQQRISRLEALLARDEDVLRKLMALLIDKGIATRDEIADRIREER